MKLSVKFLVIPLVVILLAGCSQQTSTVPTQTPSEATTDSIEPVGADAPMRKATEADSVEVKMSNYKFSTSTLTAKAGDVLVVKLVNDGGDHDFVIDELNVKSPFLAKGETQFLEIKIPDDAAGKTFEYYCSVGNHRQMGMVGKLIIE